METPDTDKLAPLDAQLTTRQLVITVDDEGTPTVDDADFTDWEVLGLATWLLHDAKAAFIEDDDE